MLNRRSFFAVSAGAIAGAAGVAAAAPAPSAINDAARKFGVDFVAAGEFDKSVLIMSGPTNTDFTFAADVGRDRFSRMHELFKDIRGQELPPWPYPPISEPNDLTREQLAANLPVIGADPLPKNTPAQRARHRALVKECNKPVPERETEKQFLKRLSLPCPGRLE